jgi:ABC-type transport system substrate-binding protein
MMKSVVRFWITAFGAFFIISSAGASPSSVVVALPVRPSAADPRDIGTDPLARSLERLRFVALVHVGPAGEIKNVLAHRVIAESPLSWRIVLRKKIRFMSGREVGADDVVATYEALRASGGGRAQQLGNVMSVNKTPEGDVVFTLREPDVRFSERLDAGILPKEALSMPRQDLLGMNFESGPYHALKISENSWILHRNDSYSALEMGFQKPTLKVISLKFLTEGAARYQALVKGAVDIVVDGFSSDKITEIKKRHGAKIRLFSGASQQKLGIGFVKSNPVVGRDEVRRKILCSVDFAKVERFSLSPLVSRVSVVDFPTCGEHSSKSEPLSFTVDTVAALEDILLAKGVAAQLQKSGFRVDVRVQSEEAFLQRLVSGNVSVFIDRSFSSALLSSIDFEKNVERHQFWNRNVFVATRKPFQELKPSFDGGVDFLVSIE